MGEAVAVLARELRSLGHDAQVVLPLTRSARETGKLRRTRKKFQIPVGGSVYPCEVWQGESASGVPTWFLRRDEYFDRSGLYGNEGGDYSDNAARFIFLSKGAVELARKLEVDAIGAHGWQAALCAVFARESGLGRPVVLTPHGLDFQGNFWSHDFGLTNLPSHYFSAQALEFYGSLNFLKGGIVFADAVVLPGELFVAAAQTPAHGCGLEKVLTGFASKLHGIPEPVEGWDQDREAKQTKRNGHPQGHALAVVFAEASQGMELLFEAVDRMVYRGLALTILGEVKEPCVAARVVAERKHREHFAYLPEFSEEQARQVLRRADFLILPGTPSPTSPWLPRALSAGVGVVARRSPGLPAYALPWPEGAGFYFHPSSPSALSGAVAAAMDALSTSGKEAIARAARTQDFSARAQAAAYARLFASLVGR